MLSWNIPSRYWPVAFLERSAKAQSGCFSYVVEANPPDTTSGADLVAEGEGFDGLGLDVGELYAKAAFPGFGPAVFGFSGFLAGFDCPFLDFASSDGDTY